MISLHVEKCFMSAVLSTHLSETVEEQKEQLLFSPPGWQDDGSTECFRLFVGYSCIASRNNRLPRAPLPKLRKLCNCWE